MTQVASNQEISLNSDYGGMISTPTGGISLNAVHIVCIRGTQVNFQTLLHPGNSFCGETGNPDGLRKWLMDRKFRPCGENLMVDPMVIADAQVIPQGIQYQDHWRPQRIIAI